MKRALIILLIIAAPLFAKKIYWVTERGTKVVTHTSNQKHIDSLEAHIKLYQKKDKDDKLMILKSVDHDSPVLTKDWTADEVKEVIEVVK